MKVNSNRNCVNLHTHTVRCGHASGTPEEYCISAVKQNFDILGFADHGPFPDNRNSASRMPFSELKDYCAELENAKEKFPMLRIFSGLEIEYSPEMKNYYSDFLLGEMNLDYLIGATHFVKMPDGAIFPFYAHKWAPAEVLNAFVRQTVQTLEELPLLYMAHPDGFGCLVEKVTPELKSGFREIAATAKALDIPLEINANGFRKGVFDTGDGSRFRYPMNAFWEIAAEFGVKTVVGSDAHLPTQLLEEYDSCLAFAEKFGLQVCNREVAERIKEKKNGVYTRLG